MHLRALAAALALPVLAAALPAQTPAVALRLSELVGDHMVMQRGVAVPVWGWAPAGARVAVTFDGKPYAATAGAGGAWTVRLPAMTAGGPHEMTVAAGSTRLAVHDILVGDVWVCSGQSNMEWVLADAKNGAQEAAAANDPMIRHFKVPQSWADRPDSTLAGGAWEVADPGHAGRFTAVGYFFARDLRRSVNVPVGLLHTSWGGTRIEPWMSARALGFGPHAMDSLMRAEREVAERTRARLAAKVGGVLPDEDAGTAGGGAPWAAPALDDAGWSSIAVPGLWEGQGYDGMDGVAWYRTSFELTEAEAGAGVRLGLGMIDDADVSWVNGHEVGRTNAYNAVRSYAVPASALRAGRNVVAVRVSDTGGGGGVYGDSAALYVDVGGTRRPLAGRWKFRVGMVAAVPTARGNATPTMLYNKMVHPLQRFPIKGVLWYQGESNADRVEDATAYRALFAGMIRDWRRSWGEVPFLWVQLANYMAVDSEPPARSAWATLRESQGAALALPRTGQAVIIDIGETGDIHPRNKQDVGARLALAARRVAYGQPVVASGPTYRAQAVRGGRVVLDFGDVGGGLVAGRPVAGAARAPSSASSAPLRGFAVAGADRRFVWANATTDGRRVTVWSDAVPHPVAVRYAWADNPLDANLYNAEGLPASPFRTDAW